MEINSQMLKFEPYFTTEDPFDSITWEKRIASVKDGSKTLFHQEVEVPSFWSQNATDIVAQHYFKVVNGEKEYSVKQCTSRVSKAFAKAGVKLGYFDKETSKVFERELRYLLVNQYVCFNSPVWYNLGVEKEGQLAACFQQSVEDTIESLTALQTSETNLFRMGSGTGTNFSPLREEGASLANGGTASGPVSFIKGFDVWAGVTKSGGKTRRAAKMVILNVNHPDIEPFIQTKVTVEKMAQDLISRGWPADYNSMTYTYLPYQNANHSVRVTDEFMNAVELDKNFDLISPKGYVTKTVKAKELFNKIAEAAHKCADPGLQFDTTINEWHTSPNSGRINGSNPCCITRTTIIVTSDGGLTIEDLYNKSINNESLPEVISYNIEKRVYTFKPINKVWIAGKTQQLVAITTTSGIRIEATPEHRFLLNDHTYLEASKLVVGQQLLEVLADKEFVVKVEHFDVQDVPVYDMEVADTHNFAVKSDITSKSSIIISNSEYMFVDDSACNLASHNLRKYYVNNTFDCVAYEKATRITITAMDIAVSISSYPTKKIEENSHKLRPLGIGWANGGALLMCMGLPYDSDKGRFWLASITSLLNAVAYSQSAVIAKVLGPCEDFAKNKTDFLKVIRKHADANYQLRHLAIEADIKDLSIVAAAEEFWRDNEQLGLQYGFRNSQATVLAPTGTIGFMMDCDTTGIEPDIAVVKHKKMAGGGWMKIVNQSVRPALVNLGYSETEIELIESHILKYETMLGAPNLKREHLPIFDCAVGIRFIKPSGHLKMMAACQPFLSGAISKTVNLPSSASVADIEEAYMQAWKLKLKAVAVYRDNCKSSQPLNVKDYTEETDQKCNFCDGKVQRAGSCLVCVCCGTPSSCS